MNNVNRDTGGHLAASQSRSPVGVLNPFGAMIKADVEAGERVLCDVSMLRTIGEILAQCSVLDEINVSRTSLTALIFHGQTSTCKANSGRLKRFKDDIYSRRHGHVDIDLAHYDKGVLLRNHHTKFNLF